MEYSIKELNKAFDNFSKTVKEVFDIKSPSEESINKTYYDKSRDYILDQAKNIINGEREGAYGAPENNFAVIADLWSTYLMSLGSRNIESKDVAAMMILMKVARISSGNYKQDNWIDICGYAALGGELEEDLSFLD